MAASAAAAAAGGRLVEYRNEPATCTIRSTIRGDYGLGYFEDGKKIGEVNRYVEA